MSRRSTITRGFHLVVHPTERMDGRYAITVRETNGARDNAREVALLPAERLDAGHGPLADALRASKLAGTALKGTRRTPVPLAEDAGVRVALALNVISGITKPGRTSRLLDGMARLSDEECFYWYAQTVGAGDDATQRRRFKALRIFLAEE
jgi:hypothetical protein